MTASTDTNLPDKLAAMAEQLPKQLRPFREACIHAGFVYTMNYSNAVVAVTDFHREKAGGLPKCGFLIAAKQSEGDDFVLLRILGEAKLPGDVASDITRQHGIERTGNEEPWSDALDKWTKDRVGLHAINCRVLGTFIAQEDGSKSYKFAEDISNYYSVSDLMVWKPDESMLNMIVNHSHRQNDAELIANPTPIGETRFSAAESETAVRTDVLLNPLDLLQRRTAYLGMSRSGKSNAMKITAESIFRLREGESGRSIGQLIFDPNGEYAQDNQQDGFGLHKIYKTVPDCNRDDNVATYGLFATSSDPDRKIMKLNFFGKRLPARWNTQQVKDALEQTLAGRDIVRGVMENETARYTSSFRDADLAVPESIEQNLGAQIRYRRTVLAYQTALAAAGLAPPDWRPSTKGLFGKKFIEVLNSSGEGSSNEQAGTYTQAAAILSDVEDKDRAISWGELEVVFDAINRLIHDKQSDFTRFDDEHMRKSSNKERWAEPRFRNIIRIFETTNGPRSFMSVREQHNPDSSIDFADDVVQDLRLGKLVIIDQSTGNPEQNKRAAERIMWKVFNTQQADFVDASKDRTKAESQVHILVYLEEAHNLLPKAKAADNLHTVWARSAKEGSKMNLGLVLATQAPSSIMPEILSETDNWILAYLNSENERRVISGYMDFGDFLDQIGKVSEPGFVRIRTLSLPYTVPVQFKRFRLQIEEADEDNS